MFRTLKKFSALLPTLLASLIVSKVQAGNVTVKMTPEAIVVTGDRTSNAIHITSMPQSGIRFTGESGTTVNGNTTFHLLVPPRNKLVINMAGGDDLVVMRELTLGGSNLEIDLGTGNDTFDLDFCGGFRAVQVTDGPADDVADDKIRLVDLTTAQTIKVVCGAGNDAVGVALATIGGDLLVETGSGNDYAGIVFNEVYDLVDVMMGTGDDFTLVDGLDFSEANFNGGSQENRLADVFFIDPLEGDIFMTLDFSGLTGDLQNMLSFEAAVGYEHEYSFLEHIIDSDLEDAIVALLEQFES